ncbi:sensor histidine kinase [Roseivirga pacifica]|uniref:sensor histidine kinase n=1 Tax=Roseivirga pacifica TaxID=1267423 RepID=UPI003BAD34AA
MTKLLNRPLKAFVLYSLIILAISIPVYVLVIDYIWTSELDENNWLTLQHTKQRLQSKQFTHAEIENINHIWGELQPGVSIVKVDGKIVLKDSIYEAIRPNVFDEDDGEDRFRGLKSFVEINGEPYVLTIETNVEEWDETFAAVAVITFFFFIILIIGFILLNKRIATKTWQPFYQTLNSLKSFELSKDSSLNLPKSDIQEFQEMNQSLLQLVKNNVDAYQQQKAFTENASHELQTPIALLKSKMDLLIQQKDLSLEISEMLNSIEAPLARLSRINKNLLVLAKVENHQYADIEELDIKECLESSITLFEDYLGDKQLQISNNVKEPILVNANSFLVETLIHNLLSNAIRHTPKSGQIEITCDGKMLYVKNSGKESLDQNHLFERFSNATKEKVSSGLGLAIVQEVANKYQWQVSYHFESGFHGFKVSF